MEAGPLGCSTWGAACTAFVAITTAFGRAPLAQGDRNDANFRRTNLKSPFSHADGEDEVSQDPPDLRPENASADNRSVKRMPPFLVFALTHRVFDARGNSNDFARLGHFVL